MKRSRKPVNSDVTDGEVGTTIFFWGKYFSPLNLVVFLGFECSLGKQLSKRSEEWQRAVRIFSVAFIQANIIENFTCQRQALGLFYWVRLWNWLLFILPFLRNILCARRWSASVDGDAHISSSVGYKWLLCAGRYCFCGSWTAIVIRKRGLPSGSSCGQA